MRGRQIMFFALLEDIKPIMENIESSVDLQYYRTGLLDNSNIPNYKSFKEIPDLGFTSSGDWNGTDAYLVVKKRILLNIREIQQRSGGIKFAVDQLMNPKSISLKLGGIYKNSENVIVAGRVATASDDEVSLELYKIFSTNIKKQFKKIGAFYVGSSAEEKLKLGWRLVTNEKLSKEFDLTTNR
ncbi:MAG: hypothetical protein ACXWW0_11925 [Bacteroidia bacterium]